MKRREAIVAICASEIAVGLTTSTVFYKGKEHQKAIQSAKDNTKAWNTYVPVKIDQSTFIQDQDFNKGPAFGGEIAYFPFNVSIDAEATKAFRKEISDAIPSQAIIEFHAAPKEDTQDKNTNPEQHVFSASFEKIAQEVFSRVETAIPPASDATKIHFANCVERAILQWMISEVYKTSIPDDSHREQKVKEKMDALPTSPIRVQADTRYNYYQHYAKLN